MDNRDRFDTMYANKDFDKFPFGGTWQTYIANRGDFDKYALPFLIPNKRVLDIGGGFGYFGNFVDRDKYYNIDISMNILRYDKNKNRILCTVTDLPLKANSFCNIVSFDVLRYVEDHTSFISEIARAIKSRGILVLGSMSSECKGMFVESTTNHVVIDGVEIYDRYWSKEELEDLLMEADFKVIHTREAKNIYPYVYVAARKK